MTWTFSVSWQPGNGATPGGPGVEYHLPTGQDTTAPIPFIVTAMAGWGTPGSYNQPVNMLAEPSAEGVQIVQLFDAFGNPLPGSQTTPLVGGSWRGQARVRVAANSPGYPFRDVGLKAWSLDGQISGGLQNNMRVYGASAPVTMDQYEIFANGISQGVASFPPGTNVTITRNGVLIWPNYIPGR